MMQTRGHRCVQRVIYARDAVEHRADLTRLKRAGAAVLRSRHAPCYLSVERKSMTALNFFAGRFLNDGIGAVGLTSVRAMPKDGSREAMWVKSGPGPTLPLSPILWHASQPDWATTLRPSFHSVMAALPSSRTTFGTVHSSASGVPAVAPL